MLIILSSVSEHKTHKVRLPKLRPTEIPFSSARKYYFGTIADVFSNGEWFMTEALAPTDRRPPKREGHSLDSNRKRESSMKVVREYWPGDTPTPYMNSPKRGVVS